MGGFTGFWGNTAMPSLDSVLSTWWGDGYGSSSLAGIIGNASNIVVGTNPAYTINDFLAIYPQFAGQPSLFTATVIDQSPVLTNVSAVGIGAYGTPISGPGGSGQVSLAAVGISSGQLVTGLGITPGSLILSFGGVGYGQGQFGGGAYGQNSILLTNPVALPPPNQQVGMVANTDSSNVLTGISNTATAWNGNPLQAELLLAGPGISQGTVIVRILSSTSALLSLPTTATASGVTLQVSEPLSAAAVTVYENPFVPIQIIEIYLHLANCCIFQERYQCLWKQAMGLFVAHYLTLFCEGNSQPASSAAQVAAAGIQSGILTSKSVGGVSAGYTNIIPASWMEMYGSFLLTKYGFVLSTLANAIPHFVYVY